MRVCILNYANGIYLKGQERLVQSLKAVGYKGDILLWSNNLPAGSPSHEDSPWAFKVFAFEEAKKQGYDIALWIDASGIVVRPLDKLFNQIEKDGYYLWGRRSSSVGQWCSDKVLESFKISRDDAMRIPEITASCIGLNLNDEKAMNFLGEWKKRALDGFSFRGIPKQYPLSITNTNENGIVSSDKRVHGHRHDQTIASILAYKLRLKQSPYGCFDYIGEAKNGKKYASYIPWNIYIVINRDIKESNYLSGLDKYGNRVGLLGHSSGILGGFFLTIERFLKDTLKTVIRRYRGFQ